jgi:hypothetical protein
VALSDPTLYLDPDLKLAWYAGSSGWDLQSLLKCVLRKIATVARSNDLIFLGGSGCGFASLYFAAGFPRLARPVVEPARRHRRLQSAACTEYGRIAFGLPDHASPCRRFLR